MAKRRLAVLALVVLLTFGIGGAASEQMLMGNPVRMYYGTLRLGNSSISPASGTKYAGKVYAEDGGNSTSGLVAISSRTAGGTLRTTTFYNPITATASPNYYWPGAQPAGNGYLLTFSTAGVMSFTDPSTLGGAFTLAGSSGTSTISAGDTLTVTAGTGVLTTPVAADAVTINTVLKRTGTLIEPATANDNLKVSSNAATPTIWGDNTSGAGGTFGVVGSAGTTSASYPGAKYGGGFGSDSGIGLLALSDTNTAFVATTDSTDNDDYSVSSLERTYLGNWADLAEQGSDPATPPAGSARQFDRNLAGTGSRKYVIDDGGYVHDLAVQAREVYPISHGPTTTAASIQADYLNGRVGLNTQAVVTVTANSTVALPAGAATYGTFTESFGRWAWTSIDAGTDTRAQFMVGTVCRDFGGTVLFSVRLRVGTVNRIGSCVLTLSDGATYATLAITPTTSFATYTSTITDTTGWTTGPLFIALWVIDSGANFGAITVDVQSFAIEQWVR